MNDNNPDLISRAAVVKMLREKADEYRKEATINESIGLTRAARDCRGHAAVASECALMIEEMKS